MRTCGERLGWTRLALAAAAAKVEAVSKACVLEMLEAPLVGVIELASELATCTLWQTENFEHTHRGGKGSGLVQ
jgi:hypothetical protein